MLGVRCYIVAVDKTLLAHTVHTSCFNYSFKWTESEVKCLWKSANIHFNNYATMKLMNEWNRINRDQIFFPSKYSVSQPISPYNRHMQYTTKNGNNNLYNYWILFAWAILSRRILIHLFRFSSLKFHIRNDGLVFFNEMVARNVTSRISSINSGSEQSTIPINYY